MIFEFKIMVAIMLYLTSKYYNFIKYFWPSGHCTSSPYISTSISKMLGAMFIPHKDPDKAKSLFPRLSL